MIEKSRMLKQTSIGILSSIRLLSINTFILFIELMLLIKVAPDICVKEMYFIAWTEGLQSMSDRHHQ